MKAHTSWSYKPYSPLLFDAGSPYICRVVPYKTGVHIEWLPDGSGTYRLYLGKMGEEPLCTGSSRECEWDFTDLEENTDYAFRVEGENGKSRLRLARTGERDGTDGVTVNYLHPKDECYAFSGRYLCSPCIVRHPQGHLLASMDVFAGERPQNLTIIFRSDDDGKTWHYLTELFPCFWGRMFIHRGRLYMLGVSTEYGDLLIGASDDGGAVFTPPTVLWRGACCWKENGIHKNPQPVVEYAGRVWNTCEWGCWARGTHAVMAFSCPADADLLNADNWSFTPPVPYDPEWPGTGKGPSCGNIEGTLAVLPDGKLYNIARYDMMRTVPDYGRVLAYRVDESDPDAPLAYSHAIELPGNHSKFVIRYDEKSACYYTIISRIRASKYKGDRNLMSLMVSRDCESWSLALDLIDKTDEDPRYTGFQYTDFIFDGDDLLWLVRTAANGADSYHDANYSVFHRLKDFRRFAP